MSDRNLISKNCIARESFSFRGESFDSLYDYCWVCDLREEKTLRLFFLPCVRRTQKRKAKGSKSKTLIRKPPKPIFHSNDFTTSCPHFFFFARNKTLVPFREFNNTFPECLFYGGPIVAFASFLCLQYFIVITKKGQKRVPPKKDSFHFKNFI
jgi:hypothetical protein